MIDGLTLQTQIEELGQLLIQLSDCQNIDDKLSILDAFPTVKSFNESQPNLNTLLNYLSRDQIFLLKSIIAIDQASFIFQQQDSLFNHIHSLKLLLGQLSEVERLYKQIGGIIGYHRAVLVLIDQENSGKKDNLENVHYMQPQGLYLDYSNREVSQVTRWGIEHLDCMAEIYPVGGAADRLDLHDEQTGAPLPAAILPFLGRTLLEGVIRDLQAREYLYYKLFGKQICTPIAMMTSHEKNNQIHILNLCQSHGWFGRCPTLFSFFTQPLVPVLTIEGNWVLMEPFKLKLKPSGHGVIWKLAYEKKIFSWFKTFKKENCLIRQINNPIAGTDHSLLSLIGFGLKNRKAFGFLSCERLMNTAEGTNVIIERKQENGYDYCLTNIEYTEFSKKGIDESAKENGSPYSRFPTNTNILFANIPSILEVIHDCPIPGQLINLKSKFYAIDKSGKKVEIKGGRLESTMQNIADVLVDHFPRRLAKQEFSQLKTFILYNQRRKTISTTKNSYQPNQSVLSTPEQAFYDLLSNNYELFLSCQFCLPSWNTIDDYLINGPACLILFHPALGPLYSIIEQKIRKGKMTQGSELKLEIAEVDIEQLDLDGSLSIIAQSPLGHHEGHLLKYGRESRAILHHVTIKNRGINHKARNCFWKDQVNHIESVQIILNEGAEFQAENIILSGNHRFEVPAFHALKLSMNENGKMSQKLHPIKQPTWQWKYAFDGEDQIRLSKI
jgi:UTP---glucose-1-phosphate uridylyltransferase